jgi:hypothetical protein
MPPRTRAATKCSPDPRPRRHPTPVPTGVRACAPAQRGAPKRVRARSRWVSAPALQVHPAWVRDGGAAPLGATECLPGVGTPSGLPSPKLSASLEQGPRRPAARLPAATWARAPALAAAGVGKPPQRHDCPPASDRRRVAVAVRREGAVGGARPQRAARTPCTDARNRAPHRGRTPRARTRPTHRTGGSTSATHPPRRAAAGSRGRGELRDPHRPAGEHDGPARRGARGTARPAPAGPR